MQVIGTVVRGELIGAAVERESALRDPVAVASDGRAEVGIRFEVAVKIVEPQDDVGDVTAAIGHANRDNRCTVRDRPHLDAAVGQGEELDVAAVRCAPER